MVVGILQFELLIHDAQSLKDKRRVVSSLKDRLHREHQVSVAEVALHDNMSVARLGLALVGVDGRYVGQALDRITAGLRRPDGAELGEVSREVLHDPTALPSPVTANPRAGDHALDDELLRRAREALRDAGEGAP